MQFYNNFDEIESTGNTIRRKNKIKAQNLMNVALSFNDQETLMKIQDLFLSLSPEEMQAFKNFLDDRKYLKSANSSAAEQKVINKIVQIAVSSVPKDPYLRKIYNEYNNNLNSIDELKIQTTQTKDCNELNKIIEQIDIYNDRNIELLETVNQYNNSK